MNNYIPADKLIAEIKRLDKENKELLKSGGSIGREFLFGIGAGYADVIKIIDSLQQEQLDNWNEQYREEDLRTRFAFYTYKDEDGILYLSNVFVEETSRNKGFGTKILQVAENVAETIGAITIRLKVKQNSPANDWYRKHGYGYLTFEDGYDWLEKNLEYLKPKQEQPEADLEKEIKLCWMNWISPSNKKEVEGVLPKTEFEMYARHFYELGLNAKKGR